jgi:eukaryotic-like serine/threonine-protein kinase
MMLELTGAHRVQPLVHTSFRELNAEFFPDGKLVAYQSNESGQDEVYVQPFPNVAGKRWKVSSGGGTRPMWARNGQELFYLAPTGAMMSVTIQRSGGGFATGTPTKLFEGPYYVGGAIGGRTYDVSPRDGRFLMMKYADASNPVAWVGNIEIVLNWTEELKHTVAN